MPCAAMPGEQRPRRARRRTRSSPGLQPSAARASRTARARADGGAASSGPSTARSSRGQSSHDACRRSADTRRASRPSAARRRVERPLRPRRALPSSSGCASITGGSIHSSPCAASGSVCQNGDATPNGCTAEQMSWTKPGSVSSAERTPPPIAVVAPRSTTTLHPACASDDGRAETVGAGADDEGVRSCAMMRIAGPMAEDPGTRAGCSSGRSRRFIWSRSSPPRSSSCRCSASTASSRSAAGCKQVPFRASPSLFYFFPTTPPSARARGSASRSSRPRTQLASAALAGVWPSAVVWAALWVLYLSFVNVGQTFYGFGWETLLCEVGFFTIFAGAGRHGAEHVADLDLALDAVPADVRRRPDQAARRRLLARSDVPRTTTSKPSPCRIR